MSPRPKPEASPPAALTPARGVDPPATIPEADRLRAEAFWSRRLADLDRLTRFAPAIPTPGVPRVTLGGRTIIPAE